MEILDLQHNIDFEQVLAKVCRVLQSEALVIMPSDSCYGLSGLAFNENVRKKIANLKGQPLDKPLSVCLASAEQLWDFVEFDAVVQDFMDLYWPGPITLILPLKKTGEWVGFRLPDHNLMRELVAKLGACIYTTSANLHGRPELYDISQLSEQFEDLKGVELILDAGMLDVNMPSAVLKYEHYQFVVVRAHPIIQNIDRSFSLKPA